MDQKTDNAPHDCPNCGHPAYVGGPGVPCQCTNRSCPFYEEDCWVKHIMELPDPWEDDDTDPQILKDASDWTFFPSGS